MLKSEQHASPPLQLPDPVEHMAGRRRQQLRRQDVLLRAGGRERPDAFLALSVPIMPLDQ